jgi:HEPN domain-containing protein
MANRYKDWYRQAEADLTHARNALQSGGFEWSCFAAQQAAEKAVKAVFLHRNQEAWGHTVTALLGNLPGTEHLSDRAKTLDKHYIPTRYPNGFDAGAPTDFYTQADAAQAISCAEEILAFCRDQIG